MDEKKAKEQETQEIEKIPYEDLRTEIVKRAPEKGRMLVYFQKKILDERYQSREELERKINEESSMILEIHLFDRSQEVRAIWSRRVEAYIYRCASQDQEKDCTETMSEQMDTKKGAMTVVNRLSYDGNGMIKIRDFRLIDGEVEV